MKKFLMIAAALVCVVCACFALAACNDKTEEQGSALVYEQVEDGYKVVGAAEGCVDETIVIPRMHNGKSVTEIGEFAFNGNETMKKVVFPSTLKRIGGDAFAECALLEEVILPEGLQEIGGYAFYGCTSIRKAYIPASVTEMGFGVFTSDEALETVTAGKGLKKYGDIAFAYCTSLKSVEFPEGMEEIGYMSFYSCTALDKVDFPSTLRMIGASSFTNCPIDDLVIPDSVVSIGSIAFGQDSSVPHIKNLTLGKGLRSIGAYAFSFTAIEHLELPAMLVDMGMAAFMYCDSLKSVTMNELGNYIPYATYANCKSLEWVVVPAVVDIVDSAFAGCENLKKIFYRGSEEEYNQYSETRNYRVGVESNENEANMFGNKYYVETPVYFYSEEENTDGKHWHFDADGMPVVWGE